MVGKFRVALMKQQSIAPLELQAAMYETQLKQLIVDEHNFEIERFFSGRIRQMFCNSGLELTKNNRFFWQTELL